MSSIARRVVVTGVGVISSIGIGWKDFWHNLLKGKSGISEIDSFDVSQFEQRYAGEIKNFSPSQFINKRKVGSLGRTSQLAIACLKLALEDSKIAIKDFKHNVGCCLGTTMGEQQVLDLIYPIDLPNNLTGGKLSLIQLYPSHSILSNVAKEFGFRNRAVMFTTACSSGNYAIGYAYDRIMMAKADIMVAGGVDSMSKFALAGFASLRAVAKEKCSPFDKNRQGMIVGEGAGMLILENLESALKRRASILAEISGYGLSSGVDSMVIPKARGMQKCMENALKQARINSYEIDYINAHGTGTEENDAAESLAVRKIFYKNGRRVPVSSIKSMLGHTMGAASAIEAIACCLAIKYGAIPPTINYETLDPNCDIDCVPNVSRKLNVDIVLNNSSAFGGNNACLVIRKYQRVTP